MQHIDKIFSSFSLEPCYELISRPGPDYLYAVEHLLGKFARPKHSQAALENELIN